MVDRDSGNGEGGSLAAQDEIPTAPLGRSKTSTEPKPEPGAAALAAAAPSTTVKPKSSGYEETIDGQLLSQRLAMEVPSLEQWDLYEILGLLGKGGMGVVYKARDRRLGRLVALKFIRGDDVVLVRRLKQEARAQASIEHPHVCKVYEVGEFHNQAYIAMQFIDGQPLAVVQCELTQPDKVLTMAMVAEAVHAAHRQGIIHRDLKPSNAALDRESQQAVPPPL